MELGNIEDDETMATVHSAEEDLLDHIIIKEEIVNKYKTQLILTNDKTEELETILGRRIIYIAEHYLDNLEDLLKKYINKGTVGIHSELPDSIYNIVQKKNNKAVFKR